MILALAGTTLDVEYWTFGRTVIRGELRWMKNIQSSVSITWLPLVPHFPREDPDYAF